MCACVALLKIAIVSESSISTDRLLLWSYASLVRFKTSSGVMLNRPRLLSVVHPRVPRACNVDLPEILKRSMHKFTTAHRTAGWTA